jgi:hypothetical protein
LNAEGEEKREQPKVDEPHMDTPAGGAVPTKELPKADDADGKPFGMSKHLFPKARRFVCSVTLPMLLVQQHWVSA